MMHRIEIRERFRARRELASLILQELRGEEVRASRDVARPVRGPAPGPIERILRTIDEWNLGAPPQGGGFAKKSQKRGTRSSDTIWHDQSCEHAFRKY